MRNRTLPHILTLAIVLLAGTLARGQADSARRSMASELFVNIDIDTVLCMGDSAMVTIGKSTLNNVVISNWEADLSHPGRVFLPDGQPCGDAGCSYLSPVTFTTFAPGATITSANNINFVRLNIEHSYIGDIYIGITCPNGQRASLMRFAGSGHSDCTASITDDDRGWLPGFNTSGGTYFGQPLDSEDITYKCDSARADNAPGIGWNYCWSNSTSAGITYAPGDAVIYRYDNAVTLDGSYHKTIDSSDVEALSNFYHPDDHFSNLIGCPLNGTWSIEVIDGYQSDNGYIFDWQLSLTATHSDSSIIVTASDVRGDSVARINDSTYAITAPDGLLADTTLPYHLLLYDSLGIVADTVVYIHHISHIYNNFTASRCQGDTVWYDGTPYTQDLHWHDTTRTNDGCRQITEIDIRFHPTYSLYDTAYYCPGQPLVWNGTEYGSPGDYTLRHLTTAHCDSTHHLTLIRQDSAFHADYLISDDNIHWATDTSFHGCTPYTILLKDTSPLGHRRTWNLGDGNTLTDDSSSYTYDTTGVFHITLYAQSPNGCRDTAIRKSIVHVYPHPLTDFRWDPEEPPVSHPTIQMQNFTQPSHSSYQWTIQRTDGNFDHDTTAAPSYTWTDGLPLGEYDITLLATLTHITPLGDTLTCTDSTTQTVTTINDWLQFPNLVTPNGDGTNDIWQIVNLLECGLYSMNELWIYDHWGALVYHRRDISRPEDFWDPAATRTPDGTYYYRFSAQSPYGIIRRNGTIEVLTTNN